MTEERNHFSPEAIAWALAEEFPSSAVKMRSDGRQSFAYIEGHTAIHRLNKATGNDWSFKVTGVQFFEEEAVIATGELTIPGLGTRGDIGTSAINRTREGRLMDNSLKGAVTDCLKRCARQFGVALYLYGEDYEEENGGAPVERYNPTQHAAYQESGTAPMQGRPSRPAADVQAQPLQRDGGQGATERQITFIRQLSHERSFTDVRFDRWLEEVYGTTLDRLSRNDASSLIERLKDPASDFGPQTQAPPQRSQMTRMSDYDDERSASTSAPPSAPLARSQGAGESIPAADGPPMTEAQQKAIYAIGKNELQIDVESEQFNDMTVLHWGAPWKDLTKRQAMMLIDLMKKEPEKLDATTLPKDAKLGAAALRWWVQRISNAQDEGEAREIHQAMKRRYASMEREHANALAVVLARWNIGTESAAA